MKQSDTEAVEPTEDGMPIQMARTPRGSAIGASIALDIALGDEILSKEHHNEASVRLAREFIIETAQAYEQGYIKGTEDHHYGDPYINHVKKEAKQELAQEILKLRKILELKNESTHEQMEIILVEDIKTLTEKLTKQQED